MKTALVVAAHPDDEILGCGGTMAHLIAKGWAVHVVILAEGATSRDLVRNRDKRTKELSILADSAQAANAIIGVSSLTMEDFPDNRMDRLDLLDLVKVIEELIQTYKPNIVFTHHAGDVNIDHQVIHDAVITACRPLPGTTVQKVLFFEVASSTEWRPPTSRSPFSPQVYYDISLQLERKIEALKAYSVEMREFPHPRSLKAIEALALWRGASCGYAAAEAFSVGRIVHPFND